MLVAERYADGLATSDELHWAWLSATYAFEELGRLFEAELAALCADEVGRMLLNSGLPRWFSVSTRHAATQAAILRDVYGNPWRPVTANKLVTEHPDGSRIWNGYFVLDQPADWFTPTVVALATAIYGGKCGRCGGKGLEPGWRGNIFDEPCLDCHGAGTLPFRSDLLSMLADALEAAGCSNEAIIRHCRGFEVVEEDAHDHRLCWQPSRGSHVRGCWAVDLILGKE